MLFLDRKIFSFRLSLWPNNHDQVFISEYLLKIVLSCAKIFSLLGNLSKLENIFSYNSIVAQTSKFSSLVNKHKGNRYIKVEFYPS